MLNITRGAVVKPQKVVLYGVEGIGKTTFAAQFPGALYIDTEGGSETYDVARLPSPQSWTALKDMVRSVAVERPCQTLVLDTADWAEKLLCAELCAKHKWESMEALNFGKCWTYALEEFGRLLDELTDVRDAGMNVVVTAHAMVSKFEQPDETASYDRWTMKMYKKNAALLKEWADALLFCNYKTIVEMVGEGFMAKGKARNAKRTLFCDHHAAWDAKNRWGLPADIPMDYAQIAPFIPVQQAPAPSAAQPAQAQAPTAQPPAKPQPDPSAASATASPAPVQTIVYGQDGSVVSDSHAAPLLPPFWAPAMQLMERDGVSIEEVQAFAVGQGHFSQDTPPENYDPAYIPGFIVPNWDAIAAKVREARDENVPF